MILTCTPLGSEKIYGIRVRYRYAQHRTCRLIFPHFSPKTLTHINIRTTQNRNNIYYRKNDKLYCGANK